jgi:hypothetical protein
MFWECQTKFASEHLPDAYPVEENVQIPMIPDSEFWIWSLIMRTYSHTMITNAADRLPALAGIARRQQEVTGGIYLAGMWKGSLMEELGWVVLPYGADLYTHVPERRSRGQWIAPSWSWIAPNAPVQIYSTAEGEPYVEVIDAQTTLAGPDPYGAVTGGELKLKCAGLVPGRHRTADVDGNRRDHLLLDDHSMFLPVSLDYAEEDFEDSEEYLYMLRLKYSKRVTGLQGIVLRATTVKGVFHRVGYFWIDKLVVHYGDEIDPMLQGFTSAMRDIRQSTAASVCHEVVEGSKFPYVIFIE